MAETLLEVSNPPDTGQLSLHCYGNREYAKELTESGKKWMETATKHTTGIPNGRERGAMRKTRNVMPKPRNTATTGNIGSNSDFVHSTEV